MQKSKKDLGDEETQSKLGVAGLRTHMRHANWAHRELVQRQCHPAADTVGP